MSRSFYNILRCSFIFCGFHYDTAHSYSLLSYSNITITILHTNDVLMHFKDSGGTAQACRSGAPCYGGLARLQPFLRKHAEHDGQLRTDVIAVDSGGLVNTSSLQTIKGETVIVFLRRLSYSVMAFGALELSSGLHNLAFYVNKMDKQFICTNIKFSETTEDGKYLNGECKKSVVIRHKRVAIGFISYIRPETLSTRDPNISILNEVASLNKEIAHLRGLDVQFIIALGYSNDHLDKDILEKVPGINVLISGHGHAMFYNGTPPSGASRDFNYPEVVPTSHGQVLVAGAYFHLVYVGNLQLVFNPRGSFLEHRLSNPVMMSHALEKLQTTDHLLRKSSILDVLLFDHMGGNLAQSPYMLDGGLSCGRRECALGSLLADVMVDLAARREDLKDPSHTQWSVTGTALLDGSLIGSSVIPGDITSLDLAHIIRNDTAVEVIYVSGEELSDLLDEMVYKTMKGATDHFLQVSGLRVFGDERVDHIEILCTECDVPKFEMLNPDRFYHVAMTRSLADRETAMEPTIGSLAEEVPRRRRPLHGSLLNATADFLLRASPVWVAERRLLISGARQRWGRLPGPARLAVVLLLFGRVVA